MVNTFAADVPNTYTLRTYVPKACRPETEYAVPNRDWSNFALIIDFELASFLGSLDTSSQVCKLNFSVIYENSLNN